MPETAEYLSTNFTPPPIPLTMFKEEEILPGGNPPEPLDQSLMTSARHGDMTAFGELIERHRATCLAVATMMLRNRSDAEDEVQNAFCKAFQRLDQYRADGS